MDRAKALADYLGIDVWEVTPTKWNEHEFDTPEGVYLVVDEDEAWEECRASIESLFDDIGFESFTPEFRDYIISNCMDTDWFEDFIQEDYEAYANDIDGDSASGNYDNRLIEEMDEAYIFEDGELAENEDSELTYVGDRSMDDLKEEFVDYLVRTAGDPVEWFIFNFGEKEFSKAAETYGSLDMDKVTDELISRDGYANELARYDGKQIDLADGWMAFRTN